MKRILTVLWLLVAGINANGQKKQNVYFFKNNGKEVKLKDSADYVRIIQEPDSGEVNFNLLEIYLDGKKKTLGKVSAFEPRLVLEGTIARFDKAGKRVDAVNYEKGIKMGMAFYYHENGKLKKQFDYFKAVFSPGIDEMIGNEASLSSLLAPNSKLIYSSDSLGTVSVREGNGHCVETTKTKLGERVEEGDYKEGVKHGTWTGKESTSNITFVETYDMGKLTSGETSVGEKKYSYTSLLEPPQFKGGKKAWADYLSRSIKYPADAAKQAIGGTVIIAFVVDVDGKIIEAKATKLVYPTLDEEARRILSWSPKWIPAKMRGVPVKVKYSQPIAFKSYVSSY